MLISLGCFGCIEEFSVHWMRPSFTNVSFDSTHRMVSTGHLRRNDVWVTRPKSCVLAETLNAKCNQSQKRTLPSPRISAGNLFNCVVEGLGVALTCEGLRGHAYLHAFLLSLPEDLRFTALAHQDSPMQIWIKQATSPSSAPWYVLCGYHKASS